MNIKLWLILFFVILSVPAFSQVLQPARFEVKLEEEDEDFLIIPAAKHGLFLFREVENKETKRDYKYQIMRLDTSLNVVWDMHNFIEVENVFIGYDFIDPYVYFLFRHSFKEQKFKVLRVEKDTREFTTFDIDLDFDLTLTEFEVIDETLVFGGYVNSQPSFVCYKFGDKRPIVLPGFHNAPNSIMQLEVEEDKKVFNILLSVTMRDRKKSISIKSYDSNGDLLKDFELRPQSDYNLLYGRSVALSHDKHLIIGTYSQKKSDMSRGIFVARVENSGDHIINYYNYADLKNFFSYMKAKREIRVKKRIERRKIKGKKNKFFYKLLVHDIIEDSGQYIMVGEAFYPKFSYGNPPFGGPGYYNYSNGSYFEGYAYTHAVVIGFNKSGKILWDNSFEIEDVLTVNLEHFVHVIPSSKGTILLYVFNDEIRSKIIKGTQVLDVRENNELKLSNEHDSVEKDSDSIVGLESWYGNNLYAFGIQDLVNYTEQGTDNKREVFFINKISVR